VSEAIKAETLVDVIGDRLRADILRGAIRPGERIVVAEIERRFQVSHIPIREALRRLEAEGLVESRPRRGTVATGLALDELADLYELRRLLEGELAARATAKRTPAQLDQLLAAHAELELAETAPDPEAAGFWTVHREFHWAILAPAATPWVRRVLDQLWQGAERYVRLQLSAHFARVEESVAQHRGLAEACRRGDPAEVRRLLCEHLSSSEDSLREGYLAMQDEPTPVGQVL
jgi:DNA-binding GntR family transcriptional regulator